jgi:hypothetical protein
MLNKIRPQILAAILCATVFAIATVYIGSQMDAVEIVTGVLGGLFGFLGGVSLKVLESE